MANQSVVAEFWEFLNGYLLLSSPDAPIYKDPAHFHNLVRSGALRKAVDETCLDVVRKKIVNVMNEVF